MIREQETEMEQNYQKKSYTLFFVWLLIFGIVLAGYSVFPNCSPVRGTGKSAGILIFIMLDLLYILICITQSIYWPGKITYEEAAAAGASARRRFALSHLLVFLAGTAIELIYCFGLESVMGTGAVRDSIVSAALVAATALCAAHIRL